MSNLLVASQYDSSGQIHASVVVALDTHQVKTYSLNQKLNVVFNLENDNRVNVIRWVSFQDNQEILALALTNGSILLYSPFTNSIITRLNSRSNFKITDFQFYKLTNSFWGSDINGSIYEWSIAFDLLQQFSINSSLDVSESINKFSIIAYDNSPHLLVGCHSIYLVNIQTKSIIKTFPGHIDLVSCIEPIHSEPDLFLTSAVNDRFINLYSISKNSTQTVFVTETPVIEIDVGINQNLSCLIARTELGCIEVFNAILNDETVITTPKKKRRQRFTVQSRTSNGIIRLTKDPEEIKGSMTSDIFVTTIKMHNDFILYSWLENSITNSNIRTASHNWVSGDANYSITSTIQLTKKATKVVASNQQIQGQDIAAVTHYNEGNTIVSDGFNLNHVVEDDEDEGEGETLAEKLEKLNTDIKTVSNKRKKGLNNNNTLNVILSQALKSNDQALLDNVLANKDQQVIQNTITRLDSSLAILLLDRISDKLARQAGKFDQLLYWIKWIVIIHGGILSSLSGLSSKLSNLHGILSKKADTLPRLMQLQGKMSIIYETAEIYRDQVSSDQDDTDVEYIEELDDDVSSDMELDSSDDIPSDVSRHDDYEHSELEDESDDEVGMITKDYIESDDE